MYKYMNILEKAIGLMQKEDNLKLFDAMAEICESYGDEFDYDDFAQWVKTYKGLLSSLEADIAEKKLLKIPINKFNSISIKDLF